MDIFEYDIFLSCSKEDKEIAKHIWHELNLKGLRVFWYDESLRKSIGQSFIDEIQNALTQSEHFLLVCTNNSINSNWVKEEYQTFYGECYIPSNMQRRMFLLRHENFNLKILPLLLKKIQMTNSIDEIIKLIGKVDIKALISENDSLKQQNEILKSEVESLKTKLQTLMNNNPESKKSYANYELEFEEAAIKQIYRHIGWGKRTIKNKVEQVGFLIGKIEYDKQNNIVSGIVEQNISEDLIFYEAGDLRNTKKKLMYLKSIIQKKLKADVPLEASKIIGWYHTLVNNSPVVVSERDKRIQKQICNEDDLFIVIFNPHKQLWKAYFGQESIECEGTVRKKSSG